METQLLPTARATEAAAPLAWDFDHLSLVPRVVSTLPHRMDAHPEVALGGARLTVPILASPMPDVCGREMCQAMAGEGALGVLHRFGSIEFQVAEFGAALGSMRGDGRRLAAAVGVTGDYRSRCDALHHAGCRVVCLDTANGAHVQTQQALAWVKRTHPDLFVIAGNVASAEGFRWLEEQGADAIRVGIAGGSVCETRTETGVYVPT
ncbi:MAG: IMP dehydrogenase, partial [Candidatus Dormibacteria bacterium]